MENFWTDTGFVESLVERSPRELAELITKDGSEKTWTYVADLMKLMLFHKNEMVLPKKGITYGYVGGT